MTATVARESIVVDASVGLALLAGDEAWLERWTAWARADNLILAPSHFAAEVAQALLRKAGLDAEDASARLERLYAAGLQTVDEGVDGIIRATDLAERHHLTTYAALYVGLAIDVEGSLATLDQDLATAAAAEGIRVLS